MRIDIDNLPQDDTPAFRVVDVSRGPTCMRVDGVGRLVSESRRDTGRFPGMRLLTAYLGGVDDYGYPRFDGEPLKGDRSGLTKGSRGCVAFALPGSGVYEFWCWGDNGVRGCIVAGDDGRIAACSPHQAAKVLQRIACTESRGPAPDE